MRSLTLRDLEDLGPRRFEELVAALVLDKHPDAEQLGGKDGGADVLRERRMGRSTVWQVKHYPRDIHWAHCEESLDSAVAAHRADRVIFVFPRNMSSPLKKTFKRRLGSRHASVEVSYMAGSQVIGALRRREHGLVEEFFGPDPRNQAKALAEHLASRGLQVSRSPEADEIGRYLELADAAGRRDRNFRTEVAVTTGDVPPPAWEEAPSLLLMTGEGERALRIAAWAEDDRGLRVGDMRFPAGEEGRRLRWEVGEALVQRRSVQLPAGVSIGLPKVPEAVRAISDVEELEGVFVSSFQAHPVKVGGELHGERIERSMELIAVPPPDAPAPGEEVIAYAGIDDEFRLFFTSVYRGEVLRMRFEPALNLATGWTPSGALEASRLTLAWYRGAGTRDMPTLDLDNLALDGSGNEQGAEMAAHAVGLFEHLVLIQDALGIEEFDLGEEVGERELIDTAIVADVLETGSGFITLSGFRGEVSVEQLDQLKRHRQGPSVARFPVYFELFGNELYLGIGEAKLPPPSTIEVSEGSTELQRQFEIRWRNEPTVPFELISRAGSPPAEIGIWLPGEVPPLHPKPPSGSV